MAKNLIFFLAPVVFLAYVLNKYYLTTDEAQWAAYFISEGFVSVSVGVIMVWAFYNMGLKLHTAAAFLYLVMALFALVSEALGKREIGGVGEPLWTALCVLTITAVLWKLIKTVKKSTT